jgi:vacuolar iron transporter family protein
VILLLFGLISLKDIFLKSMESEMESGQKKLFLEFWNDELNSATLYRALSEFEKDPRLAEVYKRMADVEILHADQWASKLKELNFSVQEFKPTWRTKLLVRLAKQFGPGMILPSMQAMEQNGTKAYSQVPEAGGMVSDERSHSLVINTITGGMEGGALAKLEGRHRSTGGNALRAAVLGANDGLVSNLSLVMGVAGAAMQNSSILITGIAGLLAGACSMALGEWLSVQSSRELYAHQIKIEGQEIETAPQEEAEELALIYEARGLKKEQAQMLANQIMENKDTALQTLAREELGMDTEELGGSAWEAAITSFLLFSVGAVVPVIPFIFMTGQTAIYVSIILSVAGLFLIGGVTSLFTGRSVLFSGGRMVIFGLMAAAVTFGIGRWIGVSIGG